jgi:hypothetical protein
VGNRFDQLTSLALLGVRMRRDYRYTDKIGLVYAATRAIDSPDCADH